MKMRALPQPILALSAAAALGMSGCSFLQPKPDLTQFYVLRASPPSAPAPVPTGRELPEIQVGPGNIAAYLASTSIVIQDGPNRLKPLDGYHWAEPLAKGLSRTLSEDLAQRLKEAQITVYPAPPTAASGCAILYSVNRFEGTLEGTVALDVTWQIVERPTGRLIHGARAVYIVPSEAGHDDIAVYVERMSRAIGLWSADVAVAIQNAGIDQR
jgi:uncharacterized lipoprotein YmbA